MRGVLRWNIPYLKAYDTKTLVSYLHVGFAIRVELFEAWPWKKGYGVVLICFCVRREKKEEFSFLIFLFRKWKMNRRIGLVHNTCPFIIL
jgi:hypothetical protein